MCSRTSSDSTTTTWKSRAVDPQAAQGVRSSGGSLGASRPQAEQKHEFMLVDFRPHEP
jgi:hypothetical protein